ncbi:MAG TPA: hypothetical protein VFR28_00235 [Allosphingosinicella sp.]|jgi:hypothetical protein|nr:hypothetical protein [Allosphingosinicella sp.]
MRWTKLRSLVKEGFADSIRSRVDIQSTRYGSCSCGHAWITLDGEVIANFCTRANYLASVGGARAGTTPRHQFTEYGELSRQDAYHACWEFVHSLPIEAALADPDPLVQSLAVLDSRVGKRRLVQLDPGGFHRLAAVLLGVRREAEGLERPKVVPLAALSR